MLLQRRTDLEAFLSKLLAATLDLETRAISPYTMAEYFDVEMAAGGPGRRLHHQITDTLAVPSPKHFGFRSRSRSGDLSGTCRHHDPD